MRKQQDDRADVAVIAEGLIRFSAMTFDQYKQHVEEHPEDKMHDLNVPGRGHRFLGLEGARAFSRLAKRQRAIDADKRAIDQVALDRAIREAFVELFIIGGRPWDEQKWIDGMLNRAVKSVKGKHEALTHYLPCVFLYRAHPLEFRIGPVRFIAATKFFEDSRRKIEADHRAAEERRKEKLEQLIAEGKYKATQRPSEEESARLSKLELDWIVEYYGAFRWIIEAAIPSCDKKVSRTRAETTAQAALDVLKLFFGAHGGKDFRLGHERGRPAKTAHLTRGTDGAFDFSWSRGGEGGSAEEGWYDDLQTNMSWALQAAGTAIEEYLQPEEVRSEHRDRWLGALNWYGQAVSERDPSAQLVKYVAALERLTVLEESKTRDKESGQTVTDVVTRRTALLAAESDDAAVLAQAREDARRLYNWRSSLMHGRTSPVTKEVLQVMHLAHKIAQRAMFAALVMYVQLDMAGKMTPQELEDRYVELEKNLPAEQARGSSPKQE